MKKAIVIGSSSGIGKELAILLSKNGYKVGITGRRKNKLEKIQIQMHLLYNLLIVQTIIVSIN